MIDFYLTKFYQDVKDPGWPDIATYNDILALPKYIQDELEQIHGLGQRLDQIESSENWRKVSRQTGFGYRKNDVVFVPVLKCASTYFKYNFLERFQGWEIVNLYDQDWAKIKAFGCMMHPLIRRLKGVTEMLFHAYPAERLDELINLLKNDSSFKGVIATTSVSDMHTMPYTAMYGQYLDKINWIPMEIGNNNMIAEVNNFLQKNSIADQIPLDESTHKSTDKKLEIFNLLMKVYFSYPPNEFPAMLLFADDLKFYHKLIKNFKQTQT
jgi:hypothetical protein